MFMRNSKKSSQHIYNQMIFILLLRLIVCENHDLVALIATSNIDEMFLDALRNARRFLRDDTSKC